MSIAAHLPRRAAYPLVLAPLLIIAACTGPAVDAPPKSVVFFTNLSAELDSGANAAIGTFAQDAMANPRRSILVEGYADRSSGSMAANRTLSELRAQVVADALAQRGVDRSRMTMRPRSPTGTEPGLESRRVELEFGR